MLLEDRLEAFVLLEVEYAASTLTSRVTQELTDPETEGLKLEA